MPHHRSSGRPEWEATTAKNLFDARKRPPPQVAWTSEEDVVLLRLMLSWTDVQEWQMKMAGSFEAECKRRDVHIPTKRGFLDIVRRLQVLQNDHLKYNITLQNRKTLYPGTDDGPLWDEESESPSSSCAAEGASHSNEEEEQQQQHEEEEQQQEEEEGSESGEDEVVEVVKVKKKKQAKVVEVEESEDDGEEEESAEEETNTSHNQAEHHLDAEDASQQQNTHFNAAAAANSQVDPPRGTKREPTLLLEAGGKRMRIGIPPKGTEIIFDPKDETVRIKF